MHGYFLNRARPILVRLVFTMKYDVILHAGKWPVSRLKINADGQSCKDPIFQILENRLKIFS